MTLGCLDICPAPHGQQPEDVQMGLPAPVVEFFFAESMYKPLSGDIGFIGRQSVYIKPNDLQIMSRKYGFTPEIAGVDTEARIVSACRHVDSRGCVIDKELMDYLGGNSFRAVDVSDYEGADMICDLSRDIPVEFYNSFDFVFDGSCLDNIFNPARALINISKLVRPGGRVVLMEHATWFNGPYTIFSPGWFFDFFVANRYADCQVYIAIFKNNEQLHYGPWQLFYYNGAIEDRDGTVPRLPDGEVQVMLLVIAEKGAQSTDEACPVQAQYRDSAYSKAVYHPSAARIAACPRPIVSRQQRSQFNQEQPFVQCDFRGVATS